MVIFGIIYAVVTTPRGKKAALAEKYPLVGVLLFFVTLCVAYYLLRLADREMVETFVGTLTIIVAYAVSSAAIRYLTKQK